ncbi:MAG: DNA primase [Candidatus Subteraquimicrobiales bacterium]|nr:DNA primase [Candidatus Subteraquimicrobiales bacterium]
MAGFIREEDVNTTRERNDLVEVVSDYVVLKKKGRYFWGLCPFHKEKTPSFKVDSIAQLYHCFGCGEGGNVFTFIMKMERLDFAEAVESLANRVGYNLRFEQTPEEVRRSSRQARLYEANRLAEELFYYILLKTEEGKPALKYLESRGFNLNLIQTFRLGCASDNGETLKQFLFKKGFKENELIDAGLVVRSEKGLYDRFQGRVIFPIKDIKGRTVAFGARTLKDALPKYLNSPETRVYHKSSILYGLFNSKSDIVKENCAIMVEGYTDLISLFGAGVKNVVATCGTAFTVDHLYLLSRFTGKVVVVFDADAAGRAAAERGLDLIGDTKVDVFVASLPAGLDPADFIKDRGKADFEEVIKNSVNLIDFCIEEILSKYSLDTTEGRIKASIDALSVISVLPGVIARQEYLRKLSQRLDISEDSLIVELARLKEAKKVTVEPQSFEKTSSQLDKQGKAEKELLRMILLYPSECSLCFSELSENHFQWADFKELFLFLKSQIIEGKLPKMANLLNVAKDDKIHRLASELVLEAPLANDKDKYFKELVVVLKDFEILRQINNLKRKLERLDAKTNPARYDTLFSEIIKLEENRRNLRK